ncbi:hypothetical protein ACFYXD_34950 [Streptomyces platensis]|uniref:hypothetical protein n=1 Tax=Streptomyces platensis TaxID=58346 RepID=UPI0036C39956
MRLENVVERVAPRDPGLWEVRPPLRRGRLVSRSRARQLRATLRQLELATGDSGMPERCGRSVQALLAPESVDAFLELASQGTFRDRRNPAAVGTPLSWSSLGMLRDCLVILGEEVGVEVTVPQVYRERLDLAPVAGQEQLELLYRRLVDADAAGSALMARSLACAGLVLDSRMRSGDLVTRRVEDVSLDEGDPWVDAVWHRQGSGRRREERVPLRPGTVVALRRWLRVRERLVGGLEGADHGALWVTVHARARPVGGVYQTYEAGLPLRAQGLRMGFAKGMARLNEALAGRWEGPGPWVPLPARVEQWRRGVEWAQEQAAAR